jgi:hypothetical protein
MEYEPAPISRRIGANKFSANKASANGGGAVLNQTLRIKTVTLTTNGLELDELLDAGLDAEQPRAEGDVGFVNRMSN